MSELSERVEELEYDLKHTKEVLTSAQNMLVAVRQDKKATVELLDEARLDLKQTKAVNHTLVSDRNDLQAHVARLEETWTSSQYKTEVTELRAVNDRLKQRVIDAEEHYRVASMDYVAQADSITKLQRDSVFYKAAMEKAQQRAMDALTELQDLRSTANNDNRRLIREKNECGAEITRLREEIKSLRIKLGQLDDQPMLRDKVIELRHEISRLQSTFITKEGGVSELTVPGQLSRLAKAIEESNRIREEELT